MKKLSSYKTTDGAQGHREGAKNGIRWLKNHRIYPESGSDAKIEKSREGALWIIKPIVVKIIQIRISEPLKPAARPNLHIQTLSKPYPNLIQTLSILSSGSRTSSAVISRRKSARKIVVRTRALCHAKMLSARAHNAAP